MAQHGDRGRDRPDSYSYSSSSVGPRAADPAVGKTTLIQQFAVPTRATERAPQATDTHAAAAHGVSGASGALPHLDAVQASFGKHDVSGVQAHTDADAGEGARAMGAEAFATGNHVAFAGAPDLHTAAHEAAHVVQQRGGVQLKGGVGAVGDAYEQHADAVADRVVQGKSAEDLLDQHAGQQAAGPRIEAGGARDAIQRAVPHERPAATTPYPGVSSYVTACDAAVQKAYNYVLHVPTLGPYKDWDGYLAQWAETWDEHTKGNPHPMMAAHFGYAVESMATLVYLPPPPAGLVTELQAPRPGTRPDVVLKEGSTDHLWLDLTAQASASHIWDKAGWRTAQHHVAEVTYPSMDPTHFNPTPNYSDDVDPLDMQHRKFWAGEIHKIRQQTWLALGKQFQAPKQRRDPVLKDTELPQMILAKLQAHFDTAFDLQTAASVLTVMGVNPATHRIIAPVSRARGTAFLLQNDPNLPSIEIPERGGMPRGLIPHGYAEELQALEQLEQMEQNGMLDFQLNQEAEQFIGPQPLGSQDGAQDLTLPEDQQLALVDQHQGGPGQDEGGELAFGSLPTFTVDLPTLQIPRPFLVQLNQYLLDNNFAFAVDLGNGPARRQLVAEPGEGFVSSLQAALAELNQERRPAFVVAREQRRMPQWQAMFTFVPRRDRRGLRAVDDRRRALPPPAQHQQQHQPPQGAVVPFGQPPVFQPPQFFFDFMSALQQQPPSSTQPGPSNSNDTEM